MMTVIKYDANKIDIFYKKKICKLYFCSTSQKLEKKYGALPLNAFTARNYLMKVF